MASHAVESTQNYESVVQWLCKRLEELHTTSAAHSQDQRRAAEAALMQFQRSDASWTLCLHLLSSTGTPALTTPTATSNVLLFAAQTLRAKINEQGSSLPDEHKQQLKQTLLQQLLNPALPLLLVRQLCLALTSLAALLPEWDDWLQHVGASLPRLNAVQLLHDLAEEGSSDWRHVTVPGLTSSEKLAWATVTRDRFRSWSGEALQLLHAWLQQQDTHQHQQHQHQEATMRLLQCLTAWVKLGCLHQVSPQQAEATAHIGLMHIQSQDEEVVSAALGLLVEVPDFAPEQLLNSLQPHMLQVAAAAVRAATATPPDLVHAAAWVAAFAAFAAAVPQRLLSGAEDDSNGAGLREGLLQVAALPQVCSNMQLVCLPALHVWSTVLGLDTSPTSSAAFTAAGGGAGSGLSRASTAGHADESFVMPTSAHAAAGAEADAPPAVQHCMTSACHQLLLHTACNCMLWAQTAEGREAAAGFEAATAVQDLFLAVCCVIGHQQYLHAIMHVWGGQQQPQQQHQPPWLQDASLQLVLPVLAAAPDKLRLQVAVDMAASAVLQHVSFDRPAADTVQQASTCIAALLSHAATHLQQGSSSTGAPEAQLVLSFCRAVQACSSYLAHYFTTKNGSKGFADMDSLLQLLLGVASAPPDEAGISRAAAAAVRALTSAALHQSWDQLYLAAPRLLQAVHGLSGVDSQDQDLFASLSMCLAAVGAPQQQLQQLRSSSRQQLIQPVVHFVSFLLQQLQAGQQWQDVGKQADAHLCQHMVRVRVVLEAAWQHREQQARRHSPGTQNGLGASTAALGSTSGQGHVRKASVASGMDDDGSDAMDGWCTHQALEASEVHCCDGSDSRADDDDPAVQSVLTQVWPLLHALVVQHGAAGRFLQHYGKCCSKLLKIQAALLFKPQQQLVQFMEVAVSGLVRPGGCGLAEPLLLAVDLCCQQQGSSLLLESAPCITQAYAQLWLLPQVLALQQPGVGDARPDLTEAILKLSGGFIRHCSILQPSSTQLSAIVPNLIAAAAACAHCCHKRVGSSALAVLMALLGAAGQQQQQGLLQELVAGHGALVAQGALHALLVPSPLPRLQKVSSILLELAALASTMERPAADNILGVQSGQAAATGPAGAVQQGSWGSIAVAGPAQGILHAWLSQATQGFVPAPLTAAEAAELAAACAGLLASSSAPGGVEGSSSGGRPATASRSYVVARRLKKRLRDFAEKHMRHGGGCSQAMPQ